MTHDQVSIFEPACDNLQDQLAKILLQVDGPGHASIKGPKAAERLAIYRNNIFASLIEALADTFPVVKALIGNDFFNAMAAVFIQQNSPKSPILAFYGAELPAFIAAFSPASGLPYLGDLAALEYQYVQAFHSADAVSLDAEAIKNRLDCDPQLIEKGMTLHPSLATIISEFSVTSLWQAHQHDSTANRAMEKPATLPESAWIFRHGLNVKILPMEEGDCFFINQLLAGCAMGTAIANTQQSSGNFDLIRCLSQLVHHHLIINFTVPQA